MGVFDKLREFLSKKNEEKQERYFDPDVERGYESKSKSLNALRRLRRSQLDELERESLNKQIIAYNRNRDSKAFLGGSILSEKGGIVKPKRVKKQRFVSGSCSFLRKGKF